MPKPTPVPFDFPSEFSRGPLSDVVRAGARGPLSTVVQAVASGFTDDHAHILDQDGCQRLLRRGFLPERDGMAGTGTVPVRVPTKAAARSGWH